MNQLFFFVSFVLVAFGFVCDRVDESRNGFFNPREAKLVAIDASGNATLENEKGKELHCHVEGYKVGDTVPLWSEVGSEHVVIQRTGDRPFEKSRTPMVSYVLAGMFFLACLFVPQLPLGLDMTKKDSLAMMEAEAQAKE